ncbi:MAG: DUF1992 domain-containing protein [Acidimicrobiia bacterium]|nr:DUF1992 domain-containing protein [Acidimicrobiia bacterium]
MDRSESVTERKIREAEERGAFDQLPGAGAPIPGDDLHLDAGWWAKERLREFREDEDRHEVLSQLTRAIDRCWGLPEEEAVERFRALAGEWHQLRQDDDRLPDAPTEEWFRSTWERMHRARP